MKKFSSLFRSFMHFQLTLVKPLTRRSRPIELGRLNCTEPVSSNFGFERGRPIDRYYINIFLSQNTNDVRGRVLEISDNGYTKRLGGKKVKQSDVLHAVEGNPKATIVSDITKADNIPSDSFDCIILTQTLQFIYDTKSAVRHLHRILKPNGVLLATMSGISQISRYDMDHWGEYWRFTTASAKQLFEEEFLPENIEVKAYGNVLSSTAFLYGLAVEDLKTEQLDYHDPNYQMLVTVRAVKADKQ
ncbi:putative methyltransferase [Methanosarcina mazei Go1]|uniref:Putative methyltransferase n=1 Tax=Methanosarcina mazei (strain ATCC BAA-159 / DSM 3647 / Goe1 / Go1 / JCM 11833 / OCM 88) TaxID=192952 RepID=Q8PV71_METMA|nr:putative methyltransferase [Methanosarcina mazei Go1]